MAIFCHSIPTFILSIRKVASICNLNMPLALNFTDIVQWAVNEDTSRKISSNFDEGHKFLLSN